MFQKKKENFVDSDDEKLAGSQAMEACFVKIMDPAHRYGYNNTGHLQLQIQKQKNALPSGRAF